MDEIVQTKTDVCITRVVILRFKWFNGWMQRPTRNTEAKTSDSTYKHVTRNCVRAVSRQIIGWGLKPTNIHWQCQTNLMLCKPKNTMFYLGYDALMQMFKCHFHVAFRVCTSFSTLQQCTLALFAVSNWIFIWWLRKRKPIRVDLLFIRPQRRLRVKIWNDLHADMWQRMYCTYNSRASYHLVILGGNRMVISFSWYMIIIKTLA